jgi:hypothetical protein
MFLDTSRCSKLSSLPFSYLRLCKSLLYLDVSFTKLNDFTPITENCTNLRALNVSGISASSHAHYTKISDLVSLEVLVMRSSNVSAVDWVGNLSQLRSLDLGITTLETDSMNMFRNQTRLQELLLDGSTLNVTDGKVSNRQHNENYSLRKNILSSAVSSSEVLDHDPSYLSPDVIYLNGLISSSFSQLVSLKLLNICESTLTPLLEQVRLSVGHDLLIENQSRRYSKLLCLLP